MQIRNAAEAMRIYARQAKDKQRSRAGGAAGEAADGP